MDTAMRDLDLIQERPDDESPGRKAAMLAMAGLSTVALVFAMGVMLGGNGETADEPRDDDPLAALAPVMVDEPAVDETTAEPESDTLAPGEVRFHEQLTDERPEVEAALAAAAAEQQVLDARAHASAVSELAATPIPPTPVVTATAPAVDFARAPTAAAIPDDVRPSAPGHDGAYTLQVVSYRTREEADLFAEALRGRGHAAFIARVELPDRGTYFRVRVGPFDTRVAADRYRATFEREEGMNTYVVDAARVAAQAPTD